jgi:cytoplasmic iron level regulating protein YaaA (DUF328/UPF0246 family)
VLVLLPPSETKTSPTTGPALDLDALVAPSLNSTRELLVRTLVRMCEGNARQAAVRLGLGPTQLDEVARNAELRTAPTARADEVYTGVLYEAWNPAASTMASREHAGRAVAIASALFGVVGAGDPIPAYRLSAGVTLPRLGALAPRWRVPLGRALTELVGDGLLVDLRSGPYANLHRPSGDLAQRTATVRVLSEANGVRKVISHFNKATKGHIVRAICDERIDAADVAEFVTALRDLGWSVETEGQRIDVIVPA